MKYFVSIGARTVAVELLGGRVVVDGTALEAHMAGVPGTPLHHLLLGGASWTVAAWPQDDPGKWVLGASGERVEVEAVDERTRAIRERAPAAPRGQGGGVIRAPMPGLVVRVRVEPGQWVEAGQGLVVVEAMKMENELRATHPAVVAEVHVVPGAAVEKGAALVTLRSAEPSS